MRHSMRIDRIHSIDSILSMIIVCPRAMRASANHTSEPVKTGGFGSTKAERSAFSP